MKKIMKKLVVCLVAGAMLFAAASCGKGDEDQNSQSTGQESNDQSSSTEETNDSLVEGEDSENSIPEESAGSNSDDQEDLGTEEGDSGWSEEMTALRSAVVESLGEDYWPDMALDSEMLEMAFGISPDLYDDFMAEMPMISNNVDTLLIIKAKEDQADAVEEALNTYRDNRVNNLSEYPMNVGKVQASRIERIGNYVLFVQLGADTMEAMDEGDEAVISHCLEVNDLVIEIISKKLEHE